PQFDALKKALYMNMLMYHRGEDSGGVAGVNPVAQFGTPRIWSASAMDQPENLHNLLFEKKDKDSQEIILPPYHGMEFATSLICSRRYCTTALNTPANMQPMLYDHMRPVRTLAVSWNGNMANYGERVPDIQKRGLWLKTGTDTEMILLDGAEALKIQSDEMKAEREAHSGDPLTYQPPDLDLGRFIRDASKEWDGGYTIAFLIGTGDMVFCTDPHHIRPGWILETDDYIAGASEDVALRTVFQVKNRDLQCLGPGQAILIKNKHKEDALY
ncbi:MAG: hypothetical protein QF632_00040, partial [Candidatus Woesearchaeota archaeon]|nr:hypothetical protein [Candidatus Woesearchaeota archaeon]